MSMVSGSGSVFIHESFYHGSVASHSTMNSVDNGKGAFHNSLSPLWEILLHLSCGPKLFLLRFSFSLSL